MAAGDGGKGAFGAASDGTGNGGAGGSITKSRVAVQDIGLTVSSGNGGSTNGVGKSKAGAGGSIESSYFGTVDSTLLVMAGAGGTGESFGGAGGKLNNLSINMPSLVGDVSAALIAGPGGVASATGAVGGKGGDITNITQTKDLNSSIDLIAAGAGGDAVNGKGGAGGNVSGIKTVGYIGNPSLGAFEPLGAFGAPFPLPQGLFAGAGGAGSTASAAGLAGSVSNVQARGIATIAALTSFGPGGFEFAAATKVSNVTAGIIAYDVDGNHVFDTESGPGIDPTAATPIDGFVLAKALSGVKASGVILDDSSPFVFLS